MARTRDAKAGAGAPSGSPPPAAEGGTAQNATQGSPKGSVSFSILANASRCIPRFLRSLQIAVVGCGHGSLDAIYSTVHASERASGKVVDLVLCCGDFQAVRNLDDLECMACPPKYRALCDFYKYYSGAVRAPIPTVFVGGNHEASAYLLELRHGGWAAPNVYYLGFAGVCRFAGLRIAGLSGIFDARDYTRPRFEAPPYDRSSMRSAYHVRAADAARLGALADAAGGSAADVLLTHDWPQHVSAHGDEAWLLRKKPFFKDDVRSGRLGSPAAMTLLKGLRPRLHFSAHLHVKFAALVKHPEKPENWVERLRRRSGEPARNADASNAAAEDRGGKQTKGHDTTTSSHPAPSPSSPSSPRETRFLALDKCLPRRPFLQIVDVPWADVAAHGLSLAHDPEWLAVLAATPGLDREAAPPGAGAGDVPRPTREQLDRVRRGLLAADGLLDANGHGEEQTRVGSSPRSSAQEPGVAESPAPAAAQPSAASAPSAAAPGSPRFPPISPSWFVRTAPAHDPSRPRGRPRMPSAPLENPQTDRLLRAIGAPEEDAWGRLRDPSRAVGWAALRGEAPGSASGALGGAPGTSGQAFCLPHKRRAAELDAAPLDAAEPEADPNEIDLGGNEGEEEGGDGGRWAAAAGAGASVACAVDPNEIDLDGFDDDDVPDGVPAAAPPAPASLPPPSPAFLAWDPTELGTRPDPLGERSADRKEPMLPALQNVLDNAKMQAGK